MPSLVNEVFRLTHSLKSESALMGFASLSELAHRMEDVLGLARDGSLSLEKPVIDSLFAGADLIAEMMAAIAQGGSDADSATARVLRGLSVFGGKGPGAAPGSGRGRGHAAGSRRSLRETPLRSQPTCR